MIVSSLIVLFLILPRIGLVDLPIGALFIASFFTFVKYRNPKFVINSYRSLRVFYFLLFIVMLFVTISFLINGNFSAVNLLKPYKLLIIFILLFYIIKVNNITFETLMHIIIVASLINAFFIYLQYTAAYLGYPELSNFGSSADIDKSTPFRKSGLMTGFPTAGLLSLLGFISMYYLYKLKNKLFYVPPMILLLITQLITSRTSLILTFLILILIFTFAKLKTKIFTIITTFIIISSLFIPLNSFMQDEYFSKTLNHMLEFWWNYQESGSFETRSTNTLMETNYYLPSDLFTMLFGNSISPHTAEVGSVKSDVFFIRVLHGTGIFSLVMYILIYIYMYYINYKSKISLQTKIYVFTVYTIVLISSFKGSYMYSSTIGDITLMLFVYQLIRLKINKKREIQ